MPKVGETIDPSYFDGEPCMLMPDALSRMKMNLNDKAVLCRLHHPDSPEETTANIDEIAQSWGLDKRAVERSLRRLEKNGFIKSVSRNEPNRFILLRRDLFILPFNEDHAKSIG